MMYKLPQQSSKASFFLFGRVVTVPARAIGLTVTAFEIGTVIGLAVKDFLGSSSLPARAVVPCLRRLEILIQVARKHAVVELLDLIRPLAV